MQTYPPFVRHPRHAPPRGIAVVIIMTMVTVAFAISYSMLRLQSTAMLVHQNADRRVSARQTALAGLSAGLRRIHLNSWAGVNSSFAITPSAIETCVVTYTAGDSLLQPQNPNYADWHYRVTITATATALHPLNPQVHSQHTAKAVVQLVPRRVGNTPNNWSAVRSRTVYQTRNAPFTVNVPVRIEGALRLQGPVQLGNLLPWSDAARGRYFDDLNLMRTGRSEVQTVSVANASGGTFRLQFNGDTTGNISYDATAWTVRSALQALSTIGSGNVSVTKPAWGEYRITFTNALATQNVPQISVGGTSLWPYWASVSTSTVQHGSSGYGDYRPFTGPLAFPQTATDAVNLSLLASQEVSLSNTSVSSAMSLPLPTSLNSYRIYPGGPTYSVPQLPSNLSNTSYAADAETNPLGVFFAPGSITLGNNVTINGTLISAGSVTLSGTNINFQPVDLRPLTGESAPVRLPAALARQNVLIGSGAGVTISGFVVAGDRFEVTEGSESASLLLEGRVVTAEFLVRQRTPWNYSALIWGWLYSLFTSQAENDGGTPYFPVYLAAFGRTPIPTLTLRPNSDSLSEHWQDLTGPVYIAHGSDPGLVWDVIRIEHD